MTDKVRARIKFDGPALDGKSMSVAHLAPALLALSDLVKSTNYYANGDRAGVQIFVNADLEQKCFELNIELAQTIWKQAQLIIADERVIAAKEIAELIGLVVGVTSGGAFSLYKLIKWVHGKNLKSVTVLKVEDGKDVTEIAVEGDSAPIIVSQAVYDLYANVAIRKKAIEVLSPLREDGYETLEFYDGDETAIIFNAENIPEADCSDLPEVIPQNQHTSQIRTGVRIRKAAYEGASKWTLVYKRAIDAAIEDTLWLERFQSGVEKALPRQLLGCNS